MLTKLIKIISATWITNQMQAKDSIYPSPDIYNFISTSGVHYYLSGDASSGIVVTTVRIHSE